MAGFVRFVLLRSGGEVKAVVADITHCRTTAQIDWALKKANQLSLEYGKRQASWKLGVTAHCS